MVHGRHENEMKLSPTKENIPLCIKYTTIYKINSLLAYYNDD